MFSERLKSLRDKKYTQQDLANLLGITRQAYGKYELGQAEPDISTINKLAEFFEVSVDYLLGRDENNLNKNKETYDPIAHLEEHFKKLGVKDAGFYDYEKWKNLNREEVEDVIKHFEFVLHKAEQRKKGLK